MSNRNYHDVLGDLYDCRDLINEAQVCGLPLVAWVPHDKPELKEKLSKVLAMNIIDPRSVGSLKLSQDFQKLLSDIAPGKPFGKYSQTDIERVALALAA